MYSTTLNGQNITSVMINTAEHHVKIYRVKKKIIIIIPPYTKQVSFVEFDKEPDEDIVVVQPTSFQKKSPIQIIIPPYTKE